MIKKTICPVGERENMVDNNIQNYELGERKATRWQREGNNFHKGKSGREREQ